MQCQKCLGYKNFVITSGSFITKCRNCGFKSSFVQPSYKYYHRDHYSYSMSRTLFNDPLLAKIISKMKFSPDDSVLDYGCGAGDYTHAISKYSKKVVGVDINIKKASTKYPSSNFKKQIGIKLDFPNNHFDKIVCVNTIEHVHLFKDLLKELKRVLKPGGKIFITTYDTDFIGNKILFDETHVFEWNKNSFCKFISSHLRVERCFCTGSFFNFFPLNWLMVYVFKPEICVIARKGQEN